MFLPDEFTGILATLAKVAEIKRFTRITFHVFARIFAEGFVELELNDETDEVSDIRYIGGYVVFRSGVKVIFGSLNGRRQALEVFSKFPPSRVEIAVVNFSGEQFPAPRIHSVREW